jgi:hypothetical protein
MILPAGRLEVAITEGIIMRKINNIEINSTPKGFLEKI